MRLENLSDHWRKPIPSSRQFKKQALLTSKPTPGLLSTVLILVLTIIFIVGYRHYDIQKTTDQRNAQEQIRAIGDLKAQEVQRWFEQRKGDAETLFKDRLDLALASFLRKPYYQERRADTLAWMRSLSRYHGYSDILLLDKNTHLLLSVQPQNGPQQEPELTFIRHALETRRIIFSDFYTNSKHGLVRLDFIIPILRNGDPNLEPLGVVVLRIDPNSFLFPLLDGWPTPSPTAETLLISRKGDDIVYLNKGRHRPDDDIPFLRLPLTTSGLLGADALTKNDEALTGIDYRGQAVLAAVRRITDTWFLVAKVDQAEIYAPIWQNMRMTVLLIGLLMLSIGLLAWLGWHKQIATLLRQHATALETRVRQRTIALETTNDALKTEIMERRLAEQRLALWERAIMTSRNGVVITDATRHDMPITAVNPAFERITGYSKAEILGDNCRFLQNEDNNQPELEKLRSALRKRQNCQVILRNYRKDGSLFWNELFIAPVRDERKKLTAYVGIINDITEQKNYEAQLEYQANHDALTHLPNRNLLFDRLQHAIARAHRNDHELAILFVDLDHFKRINDSLGHDVGDRLLYIIATRLANCIQESDTLARIGGDEFVVVLENFDHQELVLTITSSILESISHPVTLNDADLSITASVGVSLFPRDGTDAQTLLQRADAAMYSAKQQSRNSFCCYATEMNTRALEHVTLAHELRLAIEHDELVMYYQPQIDLKSGALASAEALLRWRHPRLGLLEPSTFIGLAEDTGSIIDIDNWVLRSACRQIKQWRAAGYPIARISVNLSAREFLRAELADIISDILTDIELPAHCLELEITENLLMHDIEKATHTLELLKQRGVYLAIDDFGIGYSSLNYLKRFPIDRLKIDRSFIRDLPKDSSSAAIAVAVIALGHNFNLKVLAEGVENQAQLEFLQATDCDEIQGFYTGRPVSVEQFTALLQAPNLLH